MPNTRMPNAGPECRSG